MQRALEHAALSAGDARAELHRRRWCRLLFAVRAWSCSSWRSLLHPSGTALIVCALSFTLTIVGRPPSDERPDHPHYKPQKKTMRIANFFIPSITTKKGKKEHTPPPTRKNKTLPCPYCSSTVHGNGNAALQNHKTAKHSREMNAKQPTLFEYSTATRELPQLPYKIKDSLYIELISLYV